MRRSRRALRWRSPLANFDGIYLGQSASERELVLMNILGAQRPVQIAAGLIAAR